MKHRYDPDIKTGHWHYRGWVDPVIKLLHSLVTADAKFRSVASQILAMIDTGSFAPGEPLPPEQELADRFEINRLTLRKSIKLLADEAW